MRFINDETGFSFNDWAVSIYRRRMGNRLKGHCYEYSFNATKLERQGDQWAIIAQIKGNGKKQEALAAIKKHNQGD
jgi:hypothetical protein